MTDSAVAEQTRQETQADSAASSQGQVQSIELSEAEEGAAEGAGSSIDLLLDMEVPVTVVMGQAEVPIQRLLQLNPGSVLKLNQTVDMPVELYLKDRKFATGDVVVVDDKFAVRIKQILGGKPAGR